MVGNIVDVGWATIKSGCLPITASNPWIRIGSWWVFSLKCWILIRIKWILIRNTEYNRHYYWILSCLGWGEGCGGRSGQLPSAPPVPGAEAGRPQCGHRARHSLVLAFTYLVLIPFFWSFFLLLDSFSNKIFWSDSAFYLDAISGFANTLKDKFFKLMLRVFKNFLQFSLLSISLLTVPGEPNQCWSGSETLLQTLGLLTR